MVSDDIEAQLRQINSWLNQSDWEDDERAERAIADLQQSPDKYIDSTLPAKTNWQIFKDRLGLRTSGEAAQWVRDTADQEVSRAREWIQEQLEAYGFDTVYDAYQRRESGEYPDWLADSLDDIAAETHPDFVVAEIENYVSNRLDEINSQLFDTDDTDTDAARRRREAAEAAEQAVWATISNKLGMRVDGPEDFFEKWQRRLEAAGGDGATIRRVRIDLKLNADDTIGTLFTGPGTTTYRDYLDPVRERWQAELDLEKIRAQRGNPRRTIGYMTVDIDAEEIIEIDLSEGRERFGAGGPPQPPSPRAGWQRGSVDEASGEVSYTIPTGQTIGEGAVKTTLSVAEVADDPVQYDVFVVETDVDGETVASTDVRTGIPTINAAHDTARRYMENNPFDPTEAVSQTQLADALREVFAGIAGGVEVFLDETTEDEMERATRAIESDVAPEIAQQVADAFAAAQPQLVREALAAEEQERERGDRPLAALLAALEPSGYDAPAPAFVSEGESTDAVRELSAREQDARSRLREIIRTGDPDMDRRDFLAMVIEILESGDRGDYVRIRQDDLDVLSPQLRSQLADAAREARTEWLRETAEQSDFPSVRRKVENAETANTAFVRKLLRILDPDRREENDGTFDAEELRELREYATDVRDAFLSRLEARLEELQGGGRTESQAGGVGGFSEGQAEPGLSPDDVDEFIESAAREQGGDDPTGTVRDESYLSGEPVLRDLGLEKKFERLVNDIGWRRKFPQTDWEAYWRLTDAEQNRRFDGSVERWLRTWVRNGTIDRSQLANRGFPMRVIPSAEDADFMNIERRRERRDSGIYDPDVEVDESDLTEGERRMRDALRGDDDADADDDTDDDMDAAGDFFGRL